MRASIVMGIPAALNLSTISLFLSVLRFMISSEFFLNASLLWSIKRPTMCISWSLYATDSSVPGINFTGAFCSLTASKAASIPFTESWSVSANALMPFLTAMLTSSAGEHVPSEKFE